MKKSHSPKHHVRYLLKTILFLLIVIGSVIFGLVLIMLLKLLAIAVSIGFILYVLWYFIIKKPNQ